MAWIEIVLLTIIAAGVWGEEIKSLFLRHCTSAAEMKHGDDCEDEEEGKSDTEAGVVTLPHRFCNKCVRVVARYDENGICDNCKVDA